MFALSFSTIFAINLNSSAGWLMLIWCSQLSTSTLCALSRLFHKKNILTLFWSNSVTQFATSVVNYKHWQVQNSWQVLCHQFPGPIIRLNRTTVGIQYRYHCSNSMWLTISTAQQKIQGLFHRWYNRGFGDWCACYVGLGSCLSHHHSLDKSLYFFLS